MSSLRADSSPSRARSGSRATPSTGRGASGQAVAARRPASAAPADTTADCRSATGGPTTTGPGPNRPARWLAAFSGSVVPPSTTTSRCPCTPASRSSRDRRAIIRSSSISPSGSLPSAMPAMTETGADDQFSAEAQDCRPSSTSPRTSESTTSASSRASQAPRASAVRAYTWAAAKAISLVYRSTASRSSASPPGAASLSTRDSTTSMMTRTISTACCRLTALASSRGAVPNTSPATFRVLDPVDEGRDPGLCHQAQPGPVFRRHSPEPRQAPVHGRHRGGAQRAHGRLEAAYRLLADAPPGARSCRLNAAGACWLCCACHPASLPCRRLAAGVLSGRGRARSAGPGLLAAQAKRSPQPGGDSGQVGEFRAAALGERPAAAAAPAGYRQHLLQHRPRVEPPGRGGRHADADPQRGCAGVRQQDHDDRVEFRAEPPRFGGQVGGLDARVLGDQVALAGRCRADGTRQGLRGDPGAPWPAVPGGECLDAPRQLVDGDPQPRGERPEQLLAFQRVGDGGLAGHRLDPADASADAGIADDPEQADLRRAVHVGAAAQLGGEVTERDDPDVVAVLVAEERDGAAADGVPERLDLGAPLDVGQHLGVDQPLDLVSRALRHRAGVLEVEAQPVGRDQRPGLPDMLAEYLPQGGVQQVGG